MNNDEIEKEEEEGENKFGNKCVAFLLVGVVISVGGLAWAWRHTIAGWFK